MARLREARQQRAWVPHLADEELARELGIASCIERPTNPSFEDRAATYRDASVFVRTSNEEGLGIVIQEGMASAIPTIATRCGGPDLVVEEGHTGHLVPVGYHKILCRSAATSKARRRCRPSKLSLETGGEKPTRSTARSR